MKNEEQKEKPNNKKSAFGSVSSRLPVALLALGLCSVLILWDAGLFDLPFLKRKDRREPIAETKTQEETSEENTVTLTEEKEVIDWAAYAEQTISSLYSFSFLDEGASSITLEEYTSGKTSLVKTRLPKGKYECAMGFLISEDGTIYLSSDLTPIPDGERYALTPYRDNDGNPVFCHREENRYCILAEDLTFIPSNFNPDTKTSAVSIPMPASYGLGEGNLHLTYENGLFGYSGRYSDGRRWHNVNVENQYPAAFNYSEGYAVMADDNGRITIRNDRGEAILTHMEFLLPDKEGTELLGFHYFDHGLLRVIIAMYDENGTPMESREATIDAEGNEFVFPDGFEPVSYYNGIFTVTNGEKYGHYSAKGAWITPPIYTEATPFFEGIAVVKNDEGKYGFVDLSGREVLPCTFDSVTPLSDGICLVYSEGTGYYLLTKVTGDYMPDENGEVTPPKTTEYTKITITRGPHNTFTEDEDTEILEIPQVLTTTTRPLLPEFWE